MGSPKRCGRAHVEISGARNLQLSLFFRYFAMNLIMNRKHENVDHLAYSCNDTACC